MNGVLNRRRFLLGTGGTLLALPFLEATSAAARTQTARPARLVIVFHGQGTMLDRWTPTSTGPNFNLPPLLEPLAPFKQKLTVISGIDNKVAESMGGNGHNKAGRSLLTCQPFSRGGDNGHAAGPSIDQVLAPRIQDGALFKSLHLNIGCDIGEYQLLFAGKDDPVGAMSDPREVFEQLFGSVSARGNIGTARASGQAGSPGKGGNSDTLRDRLRKARGTVLDAVSKELARISQRLGTEDRTRLELHAEKVRELERIVKGTGIGGTGGSQGCSPFDLGLSKTLKACDQASEPTLARAQIKNAAMALACNLSRVVTLQFLAYDSPTFPWLKAGIPGSYNNWHALIHRDGGTKGARDDMAFAGLKYYSEQVALLLSELDAVDEGGSSLLDNTLVLWISEFGEGGTHNTNALPVVLAGGLGGRVKTGQHLSFKGQGRTTNDLYTTVLNLFGFPDQKFGFGGSDFNHGPLAGIAV